MEFWIDRIAGVIMEVSTGMYFNERSFLFVDNEGKCQFQNDNSHTINVRLYGVRVLKLELHRASTSCC